MNKKINPFQTILIAYLILISIGTLLLLLPICNKTNISFIDALFTSTSLLTITGLIVKDTANHFTFTGQIIIMLLIQVGGIGYMTLITFFMMIFKGNISIKEQMILSESLSYSSLSGLLKFLKQVILIVFIFEIAGAIFLFINFFYENNNIKLSLFYSIFYSISAFNNAGFSLFSDSLIRYNSNIYMNLVIAFLVFVGGIGYYVIMDISLYLKDKLFYKTNSNIYKITTHSKAVLLTSFFLIIIGTLGILFLDIGNYKGVWSLDFFNRILTSFFLSVSSRSVGFTTIDFFLLHDSTLFFIIFLMFIGGSPGGTAGGIKTINFLIIFMAIINYIKGSNKVIFLNREINSKIINKAMLILSLSFIFNFIITTLISSIENKNFLYILFEVVSASATVGLSKGAVNGLSLVSEFSNIGKSLIILSMLVGKVGILSFVLAISNKDNSNRVDYPDSRFML